ncbi:hypothetical protein DOFOFD_07445 [Acetobacteraceae bacterium EV16P]|uniref:Uncharacterized protein n=1 Tax=Sorlinia euscelidii TaxID=3081148 RepID=A0ABU7U3N1_9PROT
MGAHLVKCDACGTGSEGDPDRSGEIMCDELKGFAEPAHDGDHIRHLVKGGFEGVAACHDHIREFMGLRREDAELMAFKSDRLSVLPMLFRLLSRGLAHLTNGRNLSFERRDA